MTLGAAIAETFVIGESLIGEGILAGSSEPDLEVLLGIISSGSFPPLGERIDLPPARQRQLRDAMILQAHAREGRHLLVSEDKALGPATRSRLEPLCRTRLCTRRELVAHAAADDLLTLRERP